MKKRSGTKKPAAKPRGTKKAVPAKVQKTSASKATPKAVPKAAPRALNVAAKDRTSVSGRSRPTERVTRGTWEPASLAQVSGWPAFRYPPD